jgi:hypothetical protein
MQPTGNLNPPMLPSILVVSGQLCALWERLLKNLSTGDVENTKTRRVRIGGNFGAKHKKVYLTLRLDAIPCIFQHYKTLDDLSHSAMTWKLFRYLSSLSGTKFFMDPAEIKSMDITTMELHSYTCVRGSNSVFRNLPKSVREMGRDVHRWFDNPFGVQRFIIVLQCIVLALHGISHWRDSNANNCLGLPPSNLTYWVPSTHFFNSNATGFSRVQIFHHLQQPKVPSCFYSFGCIVPLLSACPVQKSAVAGACNQRPSIWELSCFEDDLSALIIKLNITGMYLGGTHRVSSNLMLYLV